MYMFLHVQPIIKCMWDLQGINEKYNEIIFVLPLLYLELCASENLETVFFLHVLALAQSKLTV